MFVPESLVALHTGVEHTPVQGGAELDFTGPVLRGQGELEAGQVSLHDIDILHGSAANTSGRRRAGLALRYMPSTAWFRRDLEMPSSKLDWTVLPLTLVRGVNRHAANDLDVGHSAFDPASTSATF